ncbi:N-6 DNA methylase [Nocardia sp. NPDC057227]|uniref:N-6 DNA methylase n=1 Tax=Nocardia sp. NPDC057227 TaxID=3346056 RepID=UPI003639424E
MSTISAADLSRLAGVTRATVSNWRRRHADFPKPVGGSEARPVFDLDAVRIWLAEHRIDAGETPLAELRALLRGDLPPEAVTQLMRGLRAADGAWTIDAAAAPALADRAVTLLERVRRADGVRAAVDALADRALEDELAPSLHRTADPLAALMAELVTDPGDPPRTVFDPACGSGALLLAAANKGATELRGQDSVPVQVERARLTVTAETGLDIDIRLGDSLRANAFPELLADAVLTDPPYGQRDWGAAELAFDTRWQYGLPSKMESELAWVQHAVAHLRPGGSAAVLLPPAVAVRTSGRKIRAGLVRAGVLRAVIGLPQGASAPWQVGLQIWVLRRPLPEPRPAESVLFVDTTQMSAGQDIDWAAITERVIGVWRTDGGESAAAMVAAIDLLDEAVDLTPARHVHPALDTGALTSRLESATRRSTAAAAELGALQAALGDWLEGPGRSWRQVSIGELADHGWLRWIRSQREDSATDDPGIETGDVLVPLGRAERLNGHAVRVAEPEDTAAVRGPNLHTLRVDPDRLDPWFLAGFLLAGNGSAARTATVRFDPGKLRVPVLALPEQRRYGTLLRTMFRLRTAASRAAAAIEELNDTMVSGLTAGVLAPAGAPEQVDGDPFGAEGWR